jgi:AmiR/NasT family two-component response regulator
VIGQAKGILVERHGLTTDTEAFAMLVEGSQHTNIKLHDVARRLVRTPR